MIYLKKANPEDLEKGAAKGSEEALVSAAYREYQAALKKPCLSRMSGWEISSLSDPARTSPSTE